MAFGLGISFYLKTAAFKDLELVKYRVTLFLLPVQDILIFSYLAAYSLCAY